MPCGACGASLSPFLLLSLPPFSLTCAQHTRPQEMNQSTPGRTLTQHRKAAANFRGTALLKAFQVYMCVCQCVCVGGGCKYHCAFLVYRYIKLERSSRSDRPPAPGATANPPAGGAGAGGAPVPSTESGQAGTPGVPSSGVQQQRGVAVRVRHRVAWPWPRPLFACRAKLNVLVVHIAIYCRELS